MRTTGQPESYTQCNFIVRFTSQNKMLLNVSPHRTTAPTLYAGKKTFSGENSVGAKLLWSDKSWLRVKVWRILDGGCVAATVLPSVHLSIKRFQCFAIHRMNRSMKIEITFNHIAGTVLIYFFHFTSNFCSAKSKKKTIKAEIWLECRFHERIPMRLDFYVKLSEL